MPEQIRDDIYRFDDFELDASRRILLRGGEQIALNPKSLDLLLYLIIHRGSVVSKDDLLENVWPEQFVEENNLTVQISALRKIFGEKKGSNSFIATVPGRGYRFVAGIDDGPGDEAGENELVIEQRTVERILIDAPAGETINRLEGKQSSSRLLFVLVGLVLLAATGLFAFRYFGTSAKARISSIAVLPFVNQTSDENNEYLSDGLAESVTWSLSQMPDLRVMSRGSVYRYKGKDADANKIGSDLNVQAILTGRVSQHGDILNISAELVSAADNSVLWGEQFSRRQSDVEKLQSDIAGSIASKLRLKLSGAAPRMTENAEAYRTYLEALFYWNKRTAENIEKSIELFKKAIVLDPQFSQAYGGLALAYEVQVDNGAFTDDEAKQIYIRTEDAIDKALEMDDNLAEAHAARAMRRFKEWDFAGSEAEFKRALDINQNFATTHQWYSELLAAVGRTDEAIAEIERAYALDPYSRAVNMNLGLRYLAARRNDDAVVQFKKLIESEPDYPMSYVFLGSIYEDTGRLLESLEPACKADVLLKIDSPEVCEKDNQTIRAAFERDGPAGFWRENLKVNLRLYERRIVDETSVAEAYFRAGDKDKGYELLEKAFAEHSPSIVYIKIDPPFRDLGDDPRYQSLLKRIGLSK